MSTEIITGLIKQICLWVIPMTARQQMIIIIKQTRHFTLVILNHILSSADAAWTVSMFNKDLKLKTSVHMENIYSFYGEKKLIPVGCLNVTFKF